MKAKILFLAAAAAVASFAAAIPYTPTSGDRVIVGDFEFVLISAVDFEAMTNRIGKLETIAERRWTMQHSTEAGRTAWHGPRVSQEFDPERNEKVSIYSDGYRHAVPFTPTKARVPVPRGNSGNQPRGASASRPSAIPRGAWEMRHRADLARKAKPVEVSAEFGPGGKVLKVEKAEGGAK